MPLINITFYVPVAFGLAITGLIAVYAIKSIL